MSARADFVARDAAGFGVHEAVDDFGGCFGRGTKIGDWAAVGGDVEALALLDFIEDFEEVFFGVGFGDFRVHCASVDSLSFIVGSLGRREKQIP